MSNTYLGTLVDDDELAQLRAKAEWCDTVGLDAEDKAHWAYWQGRAIGAEAKAARMDVLEEAITNASLLICESSAPECRAAMKIFGKVMDEAARKRMGI